MIKPASLAACRAELQGTLGKACSFSAADRALYASDASNYRQIPLGVIWPQSTLDIVTATRICHEHRVPMLMRGGGTSQNGQCVNQTMVLDCSRHLHRVLHIDENARTALVEPGVVCDTLNAEAEKVGLTFGPDPATHSRCTLGGMIGNNSCGPHSMLAGKTVENVLELEVLTTDGARFWVGPTSEAELAEIVKRGDREGQIYTELVALRDTYAAQIRQRFPNIKRRVSGYNLDQLLPENGFNVARALVGSEGTCVSILQARVKLIENPAHKRLVVLGFENIFIAGDAVVDILPFKPIAMEGLDWAIIGGLIDRQLKLDEVALLPEGRAWLLIEIAGTTTEGLLERCETFLAAMRACSRVRSVLEVTEPATVAALWSIREQGASATAMSLHPEDPDPVVGWEDTAVDPLQLGNYLREFQALIDRYGYETSLYGHFGDGCIHARITFDTRSQEGVARWRAYSHEIAELVVRFGGSLSGEHGDGQAKAEFLPVMFGEELMEAFRRFKAAWDTASNMNPGKLIDAFRMDENLRFGPDYTTPTVVTQLQFVHDVGGFGRTTERCIGMGKCRAHSGAMCPSYQATLEERYSTRGRAHLLHELVRGELIDDAWQNTEIAESLEHCLSCKACKHECPTQVDIASWKAEFMARHYQSRRRPLSHYAFGWIGTSLPWLSHAPWLVNALQASPVKRLINPLLGLAPDQTLPALASSPFSRWAADHADAIDTHFRWFSPVDSRLADTMPADARPADKEPATIRSADTAPIILWADTANAHYRPQALISAVRVLQACGRRVGVAREHFCCGRPLYDYGFLQRARTQLQSILQHWYPALPECAPVIVVEPSCLSVFRDELLKLFPHSEPAIDLSTRAMTLTSWLSSQEVQPVRQLTRGVLHRHCHDKSLPVASDEQRWMQACFKTLEEPESGCCGMAGTYGLRAKTRAIGQTLFRRALGPAIDSAAPEATLVANGFSCHEQIRGAVNREVLHPVQVLEHCLGGR